MGVLTVVGEKSLTVGVEKVAIGSEVALSMGVLAVVVESLTVVVGSLGIGRELALLMDTLTTVVKKILTYGVETVAIG